MLRLTSRGRCLALRRTQIGRSFTPSTLRAGGHGGDAGPPLQPFKRLDWPKAPLYEDHELIWDDGVAPEMCLDLDASFVPTGEAVRWWLGGLAFFASLLGLTTLIDPASLNPAVNKAETMSDLGLSFIETGGSKHAAEAAEGEAEDAAEEDE